MKVLCTIENPTYVKQQGLYDVYGKFILALDYLVSNQGPNKTLNLQAKIPDDNRWVREGFGFPLLISYTLVDARDQVLTENEGALLYVNNGRVLSSTSLSLPLIDDCKDPSIQGLAYAIAHQLMQFI